MIKLQNGAPAAATPTFDPNRNRNPNSRRYYKLKIGYKTLQPPQASLSTLSSQKPLRYAVLGAGFAGLSVAWHLLQHSHKEIHVSIDIYDEVGIGGGASGVSGGLLHPYSPKVKLLWRGAECWKESLKLLSIAEAAVDSKLDSESRKLAKDEIIVRRRGILRPAVNLKHLDTLRDNAQKYLASCRIESIDGYAAQDLVPNLSAPLNSAFYMPDAINVHPQHYLEALFLACQHLAKDLSISAVGGKDIRLCQMSVNSLLELADATPVEKKLPCLVPAARIHYIFNSTSGEYSAVVVCSGARTVFLPELSGKLPLRTCRGVIAQLQLPNHMSESYPDHGPSILSDAWLSIQGPRDLYMGSTWEWNSKNYSTHVPTDEASKALKELLPKAYAIYSPLKNWSFIGARAGLRAMPPLSPDGSLPLLGCIDDFICGKQSCKFWLFGGLGSRGLLYHAWLGKLLAQAVISCDEGVLPSEVKSWKNKKER